jgi:dTMP kinase
VNRGRLVTFEGLDGSGKSTHCARAADELERSGIRVVRTREPTDGPWGRRIRAMARSGETVPPPEELRWFVEDRREHVRDVIQPALAQGAFVLCDRYFHSTVAYQGARGLDPWQLLAEAEAEFPVPDRTLLFVVPVEEGLRRIELRGGVREPAFERADFLERVAEIFDAIAERRDAVVRVDGLGSMDEVAERTRAVLAPISAG